MKISILILNYNTYELTLNLISSLKDTLTTVQFDLIVVDNGSNNESKEELRFASEKMGFVFLYNTNNLGYAAGNNVGLKYACEHGADYILLSNNDIEINSEEQIKKMVALIESNKRIAAVSPRIIDKNGKKDPPIYFARPSFWDYSFGIIGFNKKRMRFNEDINSKIYAPRGSFVLLRANALKEIDYLDENTFLYYEEPILAERLMKKGFECWLCGEAYVVHNHAATINKTIDKKTVLSLLQQSQKYYLSEYRKFNKFKIWLCLFFRKVIFLRR